MRSGRTLMKLKEIEDFREVLADKRDELMTETETVDHTRLGILIAMVGTIDKILGIPASDI